MTDTNCKLSGDVLRYLKRSWLHIVLIIWQHSKEDFTVGIHYMITTDRQVNLWEFLLWKEDICMYGSHCV